jgi:hypothetical protein
MPTAKKKTTSPETTPIEKKPDTNAELEKRLKRVELDVELLAQQVVIAQAALVSRLGVDLVAVANELNRA